MPKITTLEVPVKGMDCAECTQHVQHAIAKLPGVASVNVLLAAEKAIIRLDPDKVDLPAIRQAVASAGSYSVPETAPSPTTLSMGDFNRRLGLLLAGVNDAPALAQSNIGIAMGAAGTDIAIEAAHIALMREDWMLVPKVLHIAQRTMSIVKMNLAFTAVYNIVGLALAAIGILPPVLAAAAQSLPDLGILANSARLLRQE